MSPNVRMLPRVVVVGVALATTVASGCNGDVGDGSLLEALCGDGLVAPAEACDDGALVSGDGCDDACAIEDGWACAGAPSTCAERSQSICGDGEIAGIEECDDGGGVALDGCSRTCTVEVGWRCLGAPSRCTQDPPACGDRFVDTGEECDDGGVVDGDGCSAACGEEPGYDCEGAPSACTELPPGICGDGRIDVGEGCDDGGVSDGDGCGATCAVDRGYVCSGEPSVCDELPPVCGDGQLAALEACDDGNLLSGDGCDRVCATEPGFLCAGAPSTCRRGEEICAETDCTALDDDCRVGWCNPDTGACEIVDAGDGTRCDDGSLCTEGDACGAGVCIPGPMVDCSSLSSGCTRGVCDEVAGGCVGEAIPDGESCDFDPTDCVTGTCDAGVCVEAGADDCAPCGDGTMFCGGGTCGGAPPDAVFRFDGAALDFGVTTTGTGWTVSGSRPHEGAGAARSGDIGAGQRSAMTVSVALAADGRVEFWYRTSSEGCCDKLQFAVDGRVLQEWGGEIAWTRAEFPLAAGSHTLTWTYAKDGSVDSGEDAAFVDTLRISGIAADCGSTECAEVAVFNGEACVVCVAADEGAPCGAGETTCGASACVAGACTTTPAADGTSCDDNPADCVTESCAAGACVAANAADCTTCGDGTQVCGGGVCGGVAAQARGTFDAGFDGGFSSPAPAWTTTGAGRTGGASARSGAIDHGGTSILRRGVDLSGDGTAAFWFRTSTESCCDKLRFFVDGSERGAWGGEVAWTAVSFPLPAGAHSLEWRYTKDSSVVAGEDAVFIDDFVVDWDPGCGATACAEAAVFDGVTCVVCAPSPDGAACGAGATVCDAHECQGGACVRRTVPDGTSCDSDAADCVVQACSGGVCAPERRADCSACGAGGLGLCGAGVCGGVALVERGAFEGALDPGFTTAAPAWVTTTSSPRTGAGAARSADIGDGGTSTMRRTVTLGASGAVSFWYRTSTESCCDKLRFFVDGGERGNWGGTLGWTLGTFPLTEGAHTLEWRFTKDASLSNGDDAVYVDDVEISPVLCAADACVSDVVSTGASCLACGARPEGTECGGTECAPAFCRGGACTIEGVDDCTPCGGGSACMAGVCSGLRGDYVEGFESAAVPPAFVQVEGNPWTVDTSVRRSGTNALRSGATGHAEVSVVGLATNFPEASSVSFYVRTRSEATYDELEFYVDETFVQSWSGVVDWARFSTVVPAGDHALVWAFVRDDTFGSSPNAVWIDDLTMEGVAVCEGYDDVCAPVLFDGAECNLCAFDDGRSCEGGTGTCSLGLCTP